jgi:hypothetical protein
MRRSTVLSLPLQLVFPGESEWEIHWAIFPTISGREKFYNNVEIMSMS